MFHRLSLALCACLLLLAYGNPAHARKGKCRSSRQDCCVVVCDAPCWQSSCQTACYSPCYSPCYGPGNDACGVACSGCGIVHSGMVIGSGGVIHSSVIVTPIESGEDLDDDDEGQDDDPDDPFISGHGAGLSATAIAHAAARSLDNSPTFASAEGLPVSTAMAPTPGRQNSEVAGMYYGEAYHAYWAGDYRGAEALLQAGLEAADQDARLWFYRGFTEIALGRESSAIESLGRAVRLQSLHPEQNSRINASLGRVQGNLRAAIQQARVQWNAKPAPPAAPVLAAVRR